MLVKYRCTMDKPICEEDLLAEIHQIKTMQSNELLFNKVVDSTFRKYDADENGIIDLTELGNFLKTIHEEFGRAPPKDEEIKRLFDETDLDQNGTIEKEEMSKLIKKVFEQEVSRLENLLPKKK